MRAVYSTGVPPLLNRAALLCPPQVPYKQQEALTYVTQIEEAMVDGTRARARVHATSPRHLTSPPPTHTHSHAGFPFTIPAPYDTLPALKGRAEVEFTFKLKEVRASNPNLKRGVMTVVLDGYNAPVSAGNFVDLVLRGFYDGMEVQRNDGFVVQSGDPEGPAVGFTPPGANAPRTVPLEIMVKGDKLPLYGDTLEDVRRFKEDTVLPFNAFGTLAWARDEFDNNSASSQWFFLLKESELTPSGTNILDGRCERERLGGGRAHACCARHVLTCCALRAQLRRVWLRGGRAGHPA